MGDSHGDGVRPVEIHIYIGSGSRGACQTCDADLTQIHEVQLGKVAADLCVDCLKTLQALAGKEAKPDEDHR